MCDPGSVTTGAERSADEQSRSPHRTLYLALVGQVVIGAALLIWVAIGRPIPGLAGPDKDDPTLAPRATVNRFDGARAWKLLERQVKVYGPRPAGSDAARRLADELVTLLPDGHFEDVPGGLRNVVGELPGGACAYGVLAARVAGIVPDAADAATLTCWATVHGLAVMALDQRLGAEAPTERALALLVEGLLARRPRPAE